MFVRPSWAWFARVVLTEVGHGKVVVRGKGVMTMEGIIVLLGVFVRTMSVVVNRIKSCCNTFHGYIFTVFAGIRLKVRFRRFWVFAVICWRRLHFSITLRRHVGRSSKLPGFVRWAISRSAT